MSTNTINDVTVRVKLPSVVYERYEAASEKQRVAVEALLENVLSRNNDLNSKKPLTLTDAERQTLESLLAKNVSSAEELISMIRRAVTVNVNGHEIKLSPNLLTRLQSRCIGTTFDKFLQRVIVESLEEYAGLR